VSSEQHELKTANVSQREMSNDKIKKRLLDQMKRPAMMKQKIIYYKGELCLYSQAFAARSVAETVCSVAAGYTNCYVQTTHTQ